MISDRVNLRQILGIGSGEWRAWREISLISAILMELSWVTPWMQALITPEASMRLESSFWALLGIGLLAYAVLRLAALFSFSNQVRYWLLSGILLLSLAWANAWLLHPEAANIWQSFGFILSGFQNESNLLPPEFILGFCVAFVWLRGIRWATADGMPSELRLSLRIGFIMLVLYAFLFTWRGQGELSSMAYVFFLFALLALGSARLAREEAHPATFGTFFSRKWLLALLLVFGVFMLVLSLLGWGLETQLDWVRQAALSLWLLFWGLALLVFTPFLALISFLFEFIRSRADMSMFQEFLPSADVVETQDEAARETIETFQALDETFLDALQRWFESLPIAELLIAARPYFFGSLILGLIGVGIYLAGRRISLWKAISDNVREERSVESGDGWLSNMRLNWRDRLRSMRDSILRIANLDQGRKLLAAARIRRVYSFLMDLSKSLGKERHKAVTPIEFIETLDGLFPFHRKEVELISQAYVRVRYGEIDESPNEVVEVDRAWLQLRMEGEQIKRKRRKQEREAKEKAKASRTPE